MQTQNRAEQVEDAETPAFSLKVAARTLAARLGSQRGNTPQPTLEYL